jgi:hypothetical protein
MLPNLAFITAFSGKYAERANMGKIKMLCPNCERPLTRYDVRCPVCQHKLMWLYIIIVLLAFAGVTCVMLLLESL